MLTSLLLEFAKLADKYGLLDEEDARLLELQRSRLMFRVYLEWMFTASIIVSSLLILPLGIDPTALWLSQVC